MAFLAHQKGQGATEYLVLLAVVLIVAMVAIALLGFFPGLSYDSKKAETDAYWRSARPFGILEHALPAGGNLTLVVRNVDTEQMRLFNVSVAGSGYAGFNDTTTYLSGGETKTIYIAWNTTGSCAAGSIYEVYVNFTYDSSQSTNMRQYGAKSIIGKCS